jgi:hypothetical protein
MSLPLPPSRMIVQHNAAKMTALKKPHSTDCYETLGWAVDK